MQSALNSQHLPSRSASRFGLSVLAALALQACTAGARPEEPQPDQGSMLEIQNENGHDLAIYLDNGPSPRRLGLAPSMRTSTFRIPAAYVNSSSGLIVHARPIGATQTYVSPRLEVYPFSRLVLRVGSTLGLSTVAIYGGPKL